MLGDCPFDFISLIWRTSGPSTLCNVKLRNPCESSVNLWKVPPTLATTLEVFCLYVLLPRLNPEWPGAAEAVQFFLDDLMVFLALGHLLFSGSWSASSYKMQPRKNSDSESAHKWLIRPLLPLITICCRESHPHEVIWPFTFYVLSCHYKAKLSTGIPKG